MNKRAMESRNKEGRGQDAGAAAQNSFKTDNPFHSLDASLFPRKNNAAGHEPRVSKKSFRLADNVPQDEDSFAELMRLSGVETLPPKGIVSEPAEKNTNAKARAARQTRAPGARPAEDASGGIETFRENRLAAQLQNAMRASAERFESKRRESDAKRDPLVFSTLGEARGFKNVSLEKKASEASETPVEKTRRAGPENRAVKERRDIPAAWLDEEPKDPAQDADDMALFARAVGGVAPLDRKGRDIPPAPSKKPGPGETSDIQALQDLIDGKLEFAMEMSEEYIEGHVIGLDHLVIAKMRAGNYHPEAHLDMHGLNANQAYERLVGFMRGAYYKGFRCVLVIPGRGKNSPDGLGVLREKLQLWLTQEPFRRVVLAFCTAQAVHGGPGALYVLLRKYRKNRGKIHWDRLPADPDLY